MDEEEFKEPQLGAMHVMMDLLECDLTRLRRWREWYEGIKQAVVDSGMTIATHADDGSPCELGHDYPGVTSGYTFTVYVLESHVIVHTTPESRLVNVCVFFCNYRADNADKARAVGEALKSYFGSRRPVVHHIPRYS